MKPYISAYKAGQTTPNVEEEQLIYWFRPHPKDATCTSDGLGAPRGKEFLADSVFVTTMLTEPAELTVASGNQPSITISVEAGIHAHNFTMGIGQQSFSISRGGTQVLGGTSDIEISNSCTVFNYNAYVGSF
jgi:glucan endo-1,3-alpha-glucosidase